MTELTRGDGVPYHPGTPQSISEARTDSVGLMTGCMEHYRPTPALFSYRSGSPTQGLFCLQLTREGTKS